MQQDQVNIEYFFRRLYELLNGVQGTSGELNPLWVLVARIWSWIVVLGYAFSVLGLFVLVYATMRLFELRKREKEFYSTLIVTSEQAQEVNLRWKHISSLMEGGSESQWREAITEADIMLDDLLKKRGYVGDGVAEKLKSIDITELASLQDAWEAHKVRNQIAHEGSAFQLSETLAQRTLARYENVFREWGAI
jgi:hypothetical protein